VWDDSSEDEAGLPPGGAGGGLAGHGRRRPRPAPAAQSLAWRSKGHAWVESRHKVRRFFETTPGGVDGLVAQYLPPGKDEDEDPEMWRVVHDGDGDEEDLDFDDVVDALIAKDLNHKSADEMEGVRHEEERQERLSRAQRLETRSHHCSENQTPRLVAGLYGVSLPLLLRLNLKSDRGSMTDHLLLKAGTRARRGFVLLLPYFRIDGARTDGGSDGEGGDRGGRGGRGAGGGKKEQRGQRRERRWQRERERRWWWRWQWR